VFVVRTWLIVVV